MTNPHKWHERDLVRGLRDFANGKETVHGEAFRVMVCRALWALLRIDYVNTHKEAK